jgi:hypothetical protein
MNSFLLPITPRQARASGCGLDQLLGRTQMRTHLQLTLCKTGIDNDNSVFDVRPRGLAEAVVLMRLIAARQAWIFIVASELHILGGSRAVSTRLRRCVPVQLQRDGALGLRFACDSAESPQCYI